MVHLHKSRRRQAAIPASQVKQDLRDLNPRDMIDLQAFLGTLCAEDA